MPNFTWFDDSIEHSDSDAARAIVIARKITNLHNEAEQRCFRMMADVDSGYDYDPYEDCECPACIAADESGCPACEARLEDQRQLDVVQAERDLDLEMLEDKLRAIGARMMRPYEHWNEDEAYMQYMESDRY
jgi:hypothetical protein